MNLNSLNHFLLTLSDKEKQYQNGKKNTFWDTLCQTQINGRNVYILSDVVSMRSNATLWSHKQNGLKMDSLPLSVKQNSRFHTVPEHIHSYLELNYVYSGACPQTIDQKSIILKKNQVLLIDTDCPHSVEILGEKDIMISILIDKSFLRDHLFSQLSKDSILSRFFIQSMDERTKHDHYLLFHSEKNRRIPLFFHEFFCECFDPSINSSDIITHLFYLIMSELINVYENDMAKEERVSVAGQIAPIIRYIERNFQTCTLETVAEFFHLSPNYISTLLKRYTKQTYIQMIQTLKLDYAAKLLKNTEFSITEISNEAGYENVSFFYKKFYARFGCSPKDYRNSVNGKPWIPRS